jgi:hypothetical protein
VGEETGKPAVAEIAKHAAEVRALDAVLAGNGGDGGALKYGVDGAELFSESRKAIASECCGVRVSKELAGAELGQQRVPLFDTMIVDKERRKRPSAGAAALQQSSRA